MTTRLRARAGTGIGRCIDPAADSTATRPVIRGYIILYALVQTLLYALVQTLLYALLQILLYALLQTLLYALLQILLYPVVQRLALYRPREREYTDTGVHRSQVRA
jgi:hypothetical protein